MLFMDFYAVICSVLLTWCKSTPVNLYILWAELKFAHLTTYNSRMKY